MITYCSFFKESSNLGAISETAATNLTLTRSAFPDVYPYKWIYEQRSYEPAIPQLYQLLGQYSGINTRCDYRGMNAWSRINTPASGRTGP